MHPDYEAAYRCDVEKTENSRKLAIKPNDEYKRDEEFIPYETTFQRMRQVMLVKKFESIYTEVLNAEEDDQKRIDKIVEREQSRKKIIFANQDLVTKSVS